MLRTFNRAKISHFAHPSPEKNIVWFGLKGYICISNIYFLARLPLNSDWTHRGLVTHMGVGKLIVIVSDNGLSPGRRQASIWTNARTLLIRTNFSNILIGIQLFLFKKSHLRSGIHFVSASMCQSISDLLQLSKIYVSVLHNTSDPYIERCDFYTMLDI